MVTILLTISIAVVLWVVISLLLVMGAQNKKKKQMAPAAEIQRELSLSQRAFKEEAEEFEEIEEAIEETFAEDEEPLGRRPVFMAREKASWQKSIEAVPGVLGWVLLRADGAVIEASEEADLEEMGLRLSWMLQAIGDTMQDLGLTPLHTMGWEGPQGSILVAMPKAEHDLEAYMVLFTETQSFNHKVHDLLSELHWESILKGE